MFLKSYTRNLILIFVILHGVVSSGVPEKYEKVVVGLCKPYRQDGETRVYDTEADDYSVEAHFYDKQSIKYFECEDLFWEYANGLRVALDNDLNIKGDRNEIMHYMDSFLKLVSDNEPKGANLNLVHQYLHSTISKVAQTYEGNKNRSPEWKPMPGVNSFYLHFRKGVLYLESVKK